MKKNNNLSAFILLCPAFVCLFLFNFLPIMRNFFLSFNAWDMVTGDPRFIGLDNYREMAGNREFWESVRVTFQYTWMYVPLSMLGGFLIAILLKSKSKLNILYRTIFFAPYVTSMVAISAVFLFIYHPQYGTLNTILGTLGLQPVRWLNSKSTALPSLVMMNCWKSIGFCAVVYLGTLLNISDDLKEAAQIDGAGRWQTLLHIEVPLVSSATFMLVIILTIESFKVFTQINVMTGGGPDGSTTNLLTYMFAQAFEQFRVGYGGAVAAVIVSIVLVVNMIQMVFEKFVNYDM